MAKKSTTVYVCNECGFESPKWQGRCICGAWNSFFEEKISTKVDDKRSRTITAQHPQATARASSPMSLSVIQASNVRRLSTGIGELDRVIGGGVVPGSLSLMAGEPGIGKSTLILQACINVARSEPGSPVLYISGEESEEQIKLRADRLSKQLPSNLLILSETSLENISSSVRELRPSFLIVDSIQTMYLSELESVAGTVSQIRACCAELMRLAKVLRTSVFIVAHVTKSGDLAGPKVIEHLVDCVLYFNGDRSQEIRILRASKNRFGTTAEIGAFEMREQGLVEIKDVAGSFLEGLDVPQEGAIATAVVEGSRPLILELQTLISSANQNFARRSAVGIDLNRLNMMLAVLERRANINLSNYDVYANVVGGLRPEGTTMDLALILALYSSAKNLPVSEKLVAFGEIGLTGDLRAVKNTDRVVRDAIKLGFNIIVLPKKNAQVLAKDEEIVKLIQKNHVKIVSVANINEALRALY